ncbi:hypothetical protein [Vibrio spartinae]|uniref:Uncharacterized protein n=1 Tax=Vibrio spartinae TaxID=1918945 RepID=A0A1N6M5E7_9VIBR|nr:hypothetical protein [Vibrio spartinae]SIO94645.1 hypothetical protein VSP9026_02373 [Vibrio spartinae]
MAENQRTQVKAVIRRAMNAAERATNELDAQAMSELGQLYTSALTEIQQLIEHSADELGRVRLTQLNQLTYQVQSILQQLSESQSHAVDNYLVTAAQNGAHTFSTSIAAEQISTAIDDALLAVRTMTQNDGLQLSERLWRVNRHAKEVITGSIERAVIMGQSASEAAQDFQKLTQPVPAHLADQIRQSSSGRLKRTVAKNLMQDEGAPYWQIKRVMRTEINRAHGMAFQNVAFEDEFVVGTKFKLSPNHPRPDICDMHARVNLYGLGKGVYPKGKSPWPAHPNTLSYEQVVFADEITDEDRMGDASCISWLRKQNYDAQKAVLGHHKKVVALRKDHLKESMIATPWKHLEARFVKRGIDTESW